MSSPNEATPQANMNENNSYSSSMKHRAKKMLNLPYLVTFLFILKAAVILMEICGAISVSVKYDYRGYSRYYNFVAVTGIVVAILSILLNLINIVNKFSKIPWNLMELVFDILWAILILIAASLVADDARKYSDMDSYAAGAFFGFASLVIYIVDGCYRFLLWTRRDRNNQQQQASSPAY